MGAALQFNSTKQFLSDYQSFMNTIITRQNLTEKCDVKSEQQYTLYTGINPITGGECFLEIDGNLTINQVAGAKCNNIGSISGGIAQDTETIVKTHIEEFLQQQQKSDQGLFSFGFSLQINDIDNTVKLATAIKNSIDASQSAICNATASSYQNQDVVLCGVIKKDVVLNQNAIVNAQNSCAADLLVKAVNSNQALTEIALKTFQNQDSKQEGIGSLFKWLIVIAAIIAIALIIGIIIYAVFGGFSSKPKTDEGTNPEELATMLAE